MLRQLIAFVFLSGAASQDPQVISADTALLGDAGHDENELVDAGDKSGHEIFDWIEDWHSTHASWKMADHHRNAHHWKCSTSWVGTHTIGITEVRLDYSPNISAEVKKAMHEVWEANYQKMCVKLIKEKLEHTQGLGVVDHSVNKFDQGDCGSYGLKFTVAKMNTESRLFSLFQLEWGNSGSHMWWFAAGAMVLAGVSSAVAVHRAIDMRRRWTRVFECEEVVFPLEESA